MQALRYYTNLPLEIDETDSEDLDLRFDAQVGRNGDGDGLKVVRTNSHT